MEVGNEPSDQIQLAHLAKKLLLILVGHYSHSMVPGGLLVTS